MSRAGLDAYIDIWRDYEERVRRSLMAGVDGSRHEIEPSTRLYGHYFDLRVVFGEMRDAKLYDKLVLSDMTGHRYAGWRRVDNEPERIEAVAIAYKGAIVHLPAPKRHCDIIAHLDHCYPQERPFCGEQGFLTSRARFVDRKRGMVLAQAAGQIVRETGGPDELCSENLW